MARSTRLALFFYVLLSGCADDKTRVITTCNASYPPAPDGAKQIVHVAKNCPAEGADGSAGHPYPSIGQGVGAVDSQGAVLIAPGEYDESVVVDRPVSILGGADATQPDQSVTVRPPGSIGIDVNPPEDGAAVVISGVTIQGGTGAGLRLKRGQLALSRVTISNTAPSPDPDAPVGHGLVVAGGRIDASDLTVTGSASSGVLVQGGEGSLRAGKLRSNGQGGFVVIGVSSSFTLRDSELSDNIQLGVGVFAGPVSLVGNTITSTKIHQPTGVGDGILVNVNEGATNVIPVMMENNVVRGCERVGVLLGEGSTGSLTGNDIDGNATKAGYGAGVWLQARAGGDQGFVLSGNRVRNNRFLGLGATSGSNAVVSDNRIEDTIGAMAVLEIGSAMIGDGVGLFDQTTIRLTGNTIARSGRFGVIADTVDASASRVEGNTLSDNVSGGVVIQFTDNAAQLNATQNDYSGAAGLNILGASDKPFSVRKNEFSRPLPCLPAPWPGPPGVLPLAGCLRG